MKTEYKNKYIQTQIGWCTPMLLANIFFTDKLDKFLKDENYRGCDDVKTATLLNEIDPDLSLTCITTMQPFYGTLPLSLLFEIVTKKDTPDNPIKVPVIAYILTVRLIPGYYHSVAILNIDGKLWYVCPRKEYWININSEKDLQGLFMDCMEISRFTIKSTTQWAILRGESIGY